jgi:hypothetical protein
LKRRTKQEQIDTTAQEWQRSYAVHNQALFFDLNAIYEQLAALPKGATESQVAAIVGAQSWVMTYWIKNDCMVCARDVPVAIELETESDECGALRICPDCLQKAVALCQG